jgi:catechol 2,3-dioxygenase-like lactoylglutathione lyase family enzyme
MAKITGIGGIFFKCRDIEVTRAWYAQHLGLALETWGGAVLKWPDADPAGTAYSVVSFFKQDADYFAPSDAPFMVNFRVDDLDALLEQLRRDGVALAGDPTDDDFGKFAWVLDPDGRKIELWQQP